MGACPDISAWEALLAERGVEDARAAALRAHLATCASCRELHGRMLLNQRALGPLRSALRAPDDAGTDVLVGRRLGAYVLESLLGVGGMARVYRARQEHPRRTVAVKLLQAQRLAPSSLRRFRLEAEFLGRLQHPNIAQIFEAGTAEIEPPAGGELSGAQPFFAMELVAGRPLGEHVTHARLGVRERLALFVKICDAVQYAHQQGVIHRDLKPGNILVDERGEPKILDFGVARATDADVQVTTQQTDVNQLIGTLAYMSPEQVSGDPAALDARSDIYTLGVVCYELLTGRRPHDLRQRSIPEAVRAIREDDPAPLSSIERSFRGDLDTIVAKALEKDRTRRYATAAELAADIRHYLAHEPISARPASTIYQLRKFARRNAALVGGVALAFIGLFVGLIVSTWQAWRATVAEHAAKQQTVLAEQRLGEAQAARAQADEQRRAAERSRDEADAATRFLAEMLESAAPGALGREATIREVLDWATQRVESELPGQPAIQARVRDALGVTYLGLGDFDAAGQQLQQALETRRKLLGDEHPDTLHTTNNLANLLAQQDRLEEAEALYVHVLSVRRRLLGADAAETLVTQNDLAMLQLVQGRFDEARALLEDALAVSRRALGDAHPDTIVALNNLALAHMNRGDAPAAEPLLREALEAAQRVAGADHPAAIKTSLNLGLLLTSDGRWEEAERLLRDALPRGRRVLGEAHPDTLRMMTGLAMLQHQQGRGAEAEPLYVEALAACRRTLGDEHSETLRVMNNLGRLYSDLDRLDEAEPLLAAAVARARVEKVPEWLLGAFLTSHAHCLVKQGRATAAEPLLVESIELLKRSLGAGHGQTAQAARELLALYEADGREALAAPLRKMLAGAEE